MKNLVTLGLLITLFLLLCVIVINITSSKRYNRGAAFFFGLYTNSSYEVLSKHWGLAINLLSVRYLLGLMVLIAMIILLQSNSTGLMWAAIAFIFYIEISKKLVMNRVLKLGKAIEKV